MSNFNLFINEDKLLSLLNCNSMAYLSLREHFVNGNVNLVMVDIRGKKENLFKVAIQRFIFGKTNLTIGDDSIYEFIKFLIEDGFEYKKYVKDFVATCYLSLMYNKEQKEELNKLYNYFKKDLDKEYVPIIEELDIFEELVENEVVEEIVEEQVEEIVTEVIEDVIEYEDYDLYMSNVSLPNVSYSIDPELEKKVLYKTVLIDLDLSDENQISSAINLLEELGDYNDSKELITKYNQYLSNHKKYNTALNLYKNKKYDQAVTMFLELGNFRDSKTYIDKINELIKEDKYFEAINTSPNLSKNEYKSLINKMSVLSGYKNADNYIRHYQLRIELLDQYNEAVKQFNNKNYDSVKFFNLHKDMLDSQKYIKIISDYEKKYNSAVIDDYNSESITKLQESINILSSLNGYKDSNKLIEQYEKKIEDINLENQRIAKKAKTKKIAITGAFSSIILVGIFILIFTVIIPGNKHDDAISFIEDKEYSQAVEVLESLGDYKDSEELIEVISALKLLETNFEDGVNMLLSLGQTVAADYYTDKVYDIPSETFENKYVEKEHDVLGYELIKWELEDYIVEYYIDGCFVNLKLKAIYKNQSYKIEYDLSGGTFNEEYPSEYVYEGKVAIPNPYKEGYTFDEWEIDSKNVSIYNDKITSSSYGNVRLTANYIPNQYTVTFDANGGYNGTSSQTKEYKLTYGQTYSVNAVSKQGYTFVGWYCDDVKLDDEIYNIAKDATLVAKWEPVKYTINYELNGGNNGDNPEFITCEDVVTLKSPQKIGHTFVGWKYNKVVSNELELKEVFEDVTVEAMFEKNSYTITFDTNGGVSNLPVNVRYYVEGQLYKTEVLKAGAKTELLYLTTKENIFDGWYIDSTYTTKFDENVPLEKDIELYGRYTGRTIDLYPEKYSRGNPYKLHGGWTSAHSTYFVANKTGSFKIYYRNYYQYSNSSGSMTENFYVYNDTEGKYCLNKQTLKTSSSSNYSSVTVNCKQGDIIELGCWKEGILGNDLDIYFSGYETLTNISAADEINQLTVKYEDDLTLPTPTKDGYNFLGWYLDDQLFEGNKYNFDKDIVLVAKWELINI